MSFISGVTRGGGEWTPSFVTALDQKKCIGCGRCFKTCPRDVFELVDREEMGLSADDADGDDDDDFFGDDDDDDGFDDDMTMVMNLKDLMDCIGCEACSKVCPKNCLSHEPLAA